MGQPAFSAPTRWRAMGATQSSPELFGFPFPTTESEAKAMGAWRRRRRAHPRRSCGRRWLREERLCAATDIFLGETQTVRRLASRAWFPRRGGENNTRGDAGG